MKDHTDADLETVGGPGMAVQDAGDNHHGEVVNANFQFRGDCLPPTKPPEAEIVIAADQRLFEAEKKAWEAGKTVRLLDGSNETKYDHLFRDGRRR